MSVFLLQILLFFLSQVSEHKTCLWKNETNETNLTYIMTILYHWWKGSWANTAMIKPHPPPLTSMTYSYGILAILSITHGLRLLLFLILFPRSFSDHSQVLLLPQKPALRISIWPSNSGQIATVHLLEVPSMESYFHLFLVDHGLTCN